MDRSTAQTWLDAYLAAWKSYDRAEIAALFADDVVYRYHPHDAPIRGVDAVVASWLGEGDEDDTHDAPDTYDAVYRPVAIDGDVVVATGTSTYQETPGGPVTQVFDNCFVMRFDDQGRCADFVEYYVRRRTEATGREPTRRRGGAATPTSTPSLRQRAGGVGDGQPGKGGTRLAARVGGRQLMGQHRHLGQVGDARP